MGRKSSFSEAEMIEAVRAVEAGASPSATARKLAVSLQTIARWRARYGGNGRETAAAGKRESETNETSRLEDENTRLRILVANFALELDALKTALGRKR